MEISNVEAELKIEKSALQTTSLTFSRIYQMALDLSQMIQIQKDMLSFEQYPQVEASLEKTAQILKLLEDLL
jgi:hypothetical protein